MRALMLVLFCAWGAGAAAHKASDSYLNLEVDGARVNVQWDIALRDLEFALGLDTDADGVIRWGEISARKSELTAYALAHLTLRNGDVGCVPGSSELLVDQHSDGGYAVLRHTADCARQVTALEIDYRLFATLDPQHRGLVQVRSGGKTTSAVFGPDRPTQSITPAQTSRWMVWRQYVGEGVWHILIGYDHILFLMCLLLPAVAWRGREAWQTAPNWSSVCIDIIKTVTAFTLAHSFTLALAALEIASLPSRLVESLIAASVAVAAFDNLRAGGPRNRWKIAFGFGLIHGFGFAGVLVDLGLPSDALALALFGFNVGVELGQLALVAGFVPLAYGLRHSGFYRYVIYQTGSIAIGMIAIGWFIERAAAISLW